MFHITVEGPEGFAAHGTIPIAFTADARVSLPELVASHGQVIRTFPMPPCVKDYDAHPDERPEALARRFDVSGWALLAAYRGGERIGGAIVAPSAAEYGLGEAGSDAAVLVDLRVAPGWRGRGVGRALFAAAAEWARTRGRRELWVETQDINVAACWLYAACECELVSAELGAYCSDLDEARLLWRLPLAPGETGT
jgi:GNAT superfamily N-acetyltransferase